MQLLQPRQDVRFAGCVQGGQGLVHQQHPWAGGQGAGHGHALAFAARQFMRHACQQVADAQQVQPMIPSVAALRCGRAGMAEGQVALHAQVLKQAGFLKHIAQRPLVHRFEDALRAVLPHLACHADVALCLGLQPGQHTQTSGFA